MGLDMYLDGKKHFFSGCFEETEQRTEDGKKVTSLTVSIGYWRKHPNLHGFIVKNFASGVDDCRPVVLSKEDLLKTIDAVKNQNLPETAGFFFGVSDPSYDQYTLDILNDALHWLNEKVDNETRQIVYQASW
jgi:hypothetical protein